MTVILALKCQARGLRRYAARRAGMTVTLALKCQARGLRRYAAMERGDDCGPGIEMRRVADCALFDSVELANDGPGFLWGFGVLDELEVLVGDDALVGEELEIE